jgi:hypothetical protein
MLATAPPQGVFGPPRTATISIASSTAMNRGVYDLQCTGTNDHLVINYAMALLVLFSPAYGGKILLSEGRFNIGAPIMFPNNNYITLQGAGPTSTEIYLANGSNCVMIAKTTPGTTRYLNRVLDLCLNGNSANNVTGTYGVDCIGMDSLTIKGVRVYDTKSHGIYGNAVNGVMVENSWISTCTGSGIQIVASAGWFMSNLNIYNNTGAGLDVQAGYEHRGVNITCDQNGDHQFKLVSAYRCNFSNIWAACKALYKAGIFLYNAQDNAIIGGSSLPVATGTDTYGVFFYADNGNITSGNVVFGLTLDGGGFAGTYGVRQSTVGTGLVTNNKVIACTFKRQVAGNTSLTAVQPTWGVEFVSNQGYLAPGEIRSVSGVLDLAQVHATDYNLNWQNPHASKIIVTRLIIYLTTAGGTALSVLDAGTAAATGTHSDNLIDGLDLNTTGIFDNITDAGINGMSRQIVDENGGANDWVCGQIMVADAINLVGRYYIEYMGV